MFFFYTNTYFRDMYTGSVNMFTVRMDECMYLDMCGSIQIKYPSVFLFLIHSLPLALLIKTFKPFYPLNDILK